MAEEIISWPKSLRKNAGPGIEPVNVLLPVGRASDRASGPGYLYDNDDMGF